MKFPIVKDVKPKIDYCSEGIILNLDVDALFLLNEDATKDIIQDLQEALESFRKYRAQNERLKCIPLG